MLCYVWWNFMASMELQYGKFQIVWIIIGSHQNDGALTTPHHSQSYTSFQKRRCYTSLKSSQFFANVYCVDSTRKGEQNFLKCECLLYKRCGIPCLHVLKIRNEIEASMIKVQHWKIYPVHFGGENDMLSNELIKLTSIQCGNENTGVPILDAMYQGCKKSWMIGMCLIYMFILNILNLILSNINIICLNNINMDIFKLHTRGVTVCMYTWYRTK